MPIPLGKRSAPRDSRRYAPEMERYSPDMVRRVPDDRIRVLLLTNSVQVGGMEEHVRLLAQDLDHERFHVTVVFPDWDATNSFAESLTHVADDVVQITPDRRHGWARMPYEAIRLWRFARNNDFDVAHLHSTTYRGQLVMLAAVRAAGVRRTFLTEHLAPETKPSALLRLERRAMASLLTGIVCVSERNREARARFFTTPPTSTHVVNNGIDLRRFDDERTEDDAEIRSRNSIPADAPIVGTAIRFEPGKGVSDLIDAFAIAVESHPTARLLLVGDGRLRADLERQVAERDLTERVVFTGFASDPRSLIAAMDVFVLPVPFGSASIGLLEAMAMSRPCIITFGGEGEAVEHGRSGFWAEPSSPASIATHICKLLDDDDARHEMGAEARRRVEQSFASGRVAEELGSLYAP